MAKNTKTMSKDEELALGRKVQAWVQIQDELATCKNANRKKKLLQIEREGKGAYDTLVEQYTPMAAKIAVTNHKRTGTRYALEDLIQDALVALAQATLTYDPSKNCKLGTHAYYRITKMVSSTINYMRQVRLPENKMGEYNFISRAEALDTARDLSGEELLGFVSAKTGISKEEIILIKQNMQPTVSMNVPIGNGNAELSDLLPGDEDPADNYRELPYVVRRGIRELEPFEQQIIAYEYPVITPQMDYYDFLVKYNLTEKQFSTHLRRAMRKLKKIIEE